VACALKVVLRDVWRSSHLEDEGMPQKKHKPEEIAADLRQIDVLVSQGQSVAQAVRSIGVTQFTYFRWRKKVRWAQDRPRRADLAAGGAEGSTEATEDGAALDECWVLHPSAARVPERSLVPRLLREPDPRWMVIPHAQSHRRALSE
jgi:hypothetical protein